jgi:hypothetical protein
MERARRSPQSCSSMGSSRAPGVEVEPQQRRDERRRHHHTVGEPRQRLHGHDPEPPAARISSASTIIAAAISAVGRQAMPRNRIHATITATSSDCLRERISPLGSTTGRSTSLHGFALTHRRRSPSSNIECSVLKTLRAVLGRRPRRRRWTSKPVMSASVRRSSGFSLKYGSRWTRRCDSTVWTWDFARALRF